MSFSPLVAVEMMAMAPPPTTGFTLSPILEADPAQGPRSSSSTTDISWSLSRLMTMLLFRAFSRSY